MYTRKCGRINEFKGVKVELMSDQELRKAIEDFVDPIGTLGKIFNALREEIDEKNSSEEKNAPEGKEGVEENGVQDPE
jgi:hypothetical protein